MRNHLLYTVSGFNENGDDYTFEISIMPELLDCQESSTYPAGIIESGEYHAATTITSESSIPDKGNVAFYAGKSILLNAGFHAQEGSWF